MSARIGVEVGQWMVSVPGTPGTPLQHLIPPNAATRDYALTYAYVAPCSGSPLCYPADARYRDGIPLCESCRRLAASERRHG